MIHLLEQDNRIQDPAKIIPEDEPVFLIRAQDKYASRILRVYANLLMQDGEHKAAELVNQHADRMDRWPKKVMSDVVSRSEITVTEAPIAEPVKSTKSTKKKSK
jgi:hypothetical protein